jgi:hypothetical protein
VIRTTYTYAIMDVSASTYNEIAKKFTEAGYDHVFHRDVDGLVVMDMKGIALKNEEEAT